MSSFALARSLSSGALRHTAQHTSEGGAKQAGPRSAFWDLYVSICICIYVIYMYIYIHMYCMGVYIYIMYSIPRPCVSKPLWATVSV